MATTPLSKPIGTRKPHKKSKLGCSQCKQRRIKCDEGLIRSFNGAPSCQKCLNRGVVCDYVRYNTEQVQKLLIAHWEAAGSDPRTNPIQAQTHDPNITVIVEHGASFNSRQGQTKKGHIGVDQHFNGEINMGLNEGTSAQLTNNFNFDSHSQSSASISEHFHQQPLIDEHDFLLPSPDDFNNFFINNDRLSTESTDHSHNHEGFSNLNTKDLTDRVNSSSFHSEFIPALDGYLDNRVDHSSQQQSSNVNKQHPAEDELDSIFPLIKHSKLRFKASAYKKENLSETSLFHDSYTRALLSRRINDRLIQGSLNIYVFNGLLLQTTCSLVGLIPELRNYFIKFKSYCSNYIIENMNNINGLNADILLIVISSFDTSSLFERDFQFEELNLSFNSLKCLKELHVLTQDFDTLMMNTSIEKSSISNIRYYWIPEFDSNVLKEFHDILIEFGEAYIVHNGDFLSLNDSIIEEYNSILEFFESFISFLTKDHRNDLSYSAINSKMKYPIPDLYKLVKRIYSIFPSGCLNNFSSERISPIKRVFYMLFFALFSQLETLIAGSRHFLDYFLNGYLLNRPFNKEEITLLEHEDYINLNWYLNYAYQLISFANRRTSYVIRNTAVTNPRERNFSTVARSSVSDLEIQERCIKTFRDSILKDIKYPTVLNDNPAEQLLIKSSSPSLEPQRPSMSRTTTSVNGIDYISTPRSEVSMSDYAILSSVNKKTLTSYVDDLTKDSILDDSVGIIEEEINVQLEFLDFFKCIVE